MSEQIEVKKETLWKIATFVFAALFLITLFYNSGSNGGSAGNDNEVGQIPPTAVNPPTSNVQIKIDDSDPILGDKNAEISIVEFSDFQCPFCARAYNDAIAQFKTSNYYKNGDVNLVYKHFPLNSIHPQAQKAAEASECANRQDKFWEMHDKIFENPNAMDITSLKSYAGQIGLDQGKFDKCLDGNEAAGKVANDLKQSTEAGGRGTPYFVLVNKDGKTVVVSGAQPWTNFESAIKSLQ